MGGHTLARDSVMEFKDGWMDLMGWTDGWMKGCALAGSG